MIRLGLALLVGGWVIYTAGATTVGGWGMVLGVLALAAWVRFRASHRSMVVRTAGGHGTRTAAEHEDGHLRVGKAFRREGVRTGTATIAPDGSGVTQVWIPRDADPNVDIAISRAGRLASGTSAGCGGGSFLPSRGSDDWHTGRAVRRGGSVAEGDRLARQALGRSRSRAGELHRNGEIR